MIRANTTKLSCPKCTNEKISVWRYSQRHGKTYGWMLNCPNCGKFLIVQVEGVQEK